MAGIPIVGRQGLGAKPSWLPASRCLLKYICIYFRLFLAPGINHCFGGNGACPDGTFDAMGEWVETGVVPDTLAASTVGTSQRFMRPLCPYPKQQVYNAVNNATAGQGFSYA